MIVHYFSVLLTQGVRLIDTDCGALSYTTKLCFDIWDLKGNPWGAEGSISWDLLWQSGVCSGVPMQGLRHCVVVCELEDYVDL